jgi:hypothetical protein
MPEDLEEISEELLKESISEAIHILGIGKKNITYEYWPTLQAKVLELYQRQRNIHRTRKAVNLPNLSQFRFNTTSINEDDRELANSIKQNVLQSAREQMPGIPTGPLPITHSLLQASINKTAKNVFNIKQRSRIYNRRRALERAAEEAQKEARKRAIVEEEKAIAEQIRIQAEIRRIDALKDELEELGINLTERNNPDPSIPFERFLQIRLAEAKGLAAPPVVPRLNNVVPEVVPRLNNVGAVQAPNGLRQRRGVRAAEVAEVRREALFAVPAQQQAAVLQERVNNRNASVDAQRALLEESNRMQAIFLSFQAEQAEQRATEARNIQRVAERGIREAAAARQGVVNVREGQERQDVRLFEIRKTGNEIMTKVDENLQISRRVEKGVEEVRRLAQLLASDRKGFFKAILNNEFAMFVVFFTLHTQFPITISNVQHIYYMGMPIKKIYDRVVNRENRQFSLTIGGVVTEISPFIFSTIFYYYTHKMMEENIANTPEYQEAFGNTLESYIIAFVRSPIHYINTYRETGQIGMPTLEQIKQVINTTFIGPFCEYIARAFNLPWAHPGKVAEIILKAMGEGITITIDKATIVIGRKQVWFQLTTLNAAVTTVFYDILSTITMYGGRTVWKLVQWGVSYGICYVKSKLPYVMGGQDFIMCMSEAEAHPHQDGGDPTNTDIIYRAALDDLYYKHPSQFDYLLELGKYQYNLTNLYFIYQTSYPTKAMNSLLENQLLLGSYFYEVQMYSSLGFTPDSEPFYFKIAQGKAIQNSEPLLFLENKSSVKNKLNGGRMKTRRHRKNRRHLSRKH